MTATRTALPESFTQRSAGEVLDVYEEEAVVWLWAHSYLLEWPRNLIWIDSPVTGNARWPGDLWGIDAEGELLILEAKRGTGVDPFKDFVTYHQPTRIELTASHLFPRWMRQYKGECRYSSGLVPRPEGKTMGLLPRSSHRFALLRWPYLTSCIDAQIRSEQYVQSVRDYLARRRDRKNPSPHYAGLVIQTTLKEPRLSKRGLQTFCNLQVTAGGDHVQVFIAKAQILPEGEIEISIAPHAAS